MPKETIEFKTKNGSVKVERNANQATVTTERTCFGFQETAVIKVKLIDADGDHYAFDDEKTLKETYKTH